MDTFKKLNHFDSRLAMLVKLCLDGKKPVSRIDGFEGPEEVVAKLLREMGLSVETKKSGCRGDLVFGTKEGIIRYKNARVLKGKERIVEQGLVFGYPKCCATYFSEFVSGEKTEKAKRMKPLEHFVCPNCEKSEKLKKEYEIALNSI